MSGSHAPPRTAFGLGPSALQSSATIVTVGVIAMLIALVVGGFVHITRLQGELSDVREATRQMRMARQAVMEANTAVLHALAKTAERADRRLYFDALIRINSHAADHYPKAVVHDGVVRTGAETVAELRKAWAETLDQVENGQDAQARAVYVRSEAQGELQALIEAFFAQLDTYEVAYAAAQKSHDVATTAVLTLQIATGLVCIFAFLFAARRGARESTARAMAVTSADAAREQVTRLFQMTEMLQSAADYPDANAVLQATAEELIPGFGGALYVFNNSRDRLALSTSWGLEQSAELPDTIGLQHCWALKRGKPHVNLPAGRKLCCEHHGGPHGALEIPMIARGDILGLLQIFAVGADAEARLNQISGLGAALADAMSLALANIALRDKLRSQALRDPLTGLYNRRYMEDTLQRVVRLAERERHEVSVIMIDLDHFKRLNDQHGHAKGDAVLRDAAAAIVSQLRDTDVACRYGGEELIVVLPNCGIDDAAHKAERIRIGVEGLSEPNGAQVSASLGVATFPQTATAMKDLVANADAALYRAKQEGRNRVVRADARVRPTSGRGKSEETLDKEMKSAEAA